MNDTIHVTVQELHLVITTACERAGLTTEAARDMADSLTEAECTGKQSHGLLRVEYVVRESIRQKPGPVEVDREGPSFLGMNGNRHMGYHPGVVGIEKGVEIAQRTGLCFLGIHNCIHSGMLGFFARRIARLGYWGLIMAHSAPMMAPHGCAQSVFGTNPMALGVPRQETDPLIIDFSPASYTYGAVSLDQKQGRALPPDVGLDREGRPTTDPAEVMDGGTLLPAAGHKGSALALIIQLLCGPLLGASAVPERMGDYGLSIMIFSPGMFHDAAQTSQGVEEIIEAILSCAQVQGAGEVRLPGAGSEAALRSAHERGIDVDTKLWERALELAGYTSEP